MKDFEKISERRRDVLLRRMGLKNGEPETLDEIGKCFGVSRERIRQVEEQAIKDLEQIVPDIDVNIIELVRVWQRSSKIKEVADRMGLSYSKCRRYAESIRNTGIGIKKFRRGNPQPPKAMSEKERLAVAQSFSERVSRRNSFLELWNNGTPTKEIARVFGFGNRHTVNAMASRYRAAGFDCRHRLKKSKLLCSNEDFIKAWQKSSSIKDVIEKTGMSLHAVNRRRHTLVKRGIPLKSYRRYKFLKKSDVRRLKEIALKLID